MLTAIYDGKCVLCNQSRRMVRLLDWGKRIEFADLHQADTRARFPHVDYELAMGAMHLPQTAKRCTMVSRLCAACCANCRWACLCGRCCTCRA
jgi:predicted DCC family thiol-disulfide oxidoreductase YuxK